MKALLAALLAGLPAIALCEESLPDPDTLRQIEVRDRILLNHAWGRGLAEAYYRGTPLATLPLSLPEERPQKLALLCVQGADDAANLTTFLAEEGYQADRCLSRAALEEALIQGGYELAVVEVDADRERPSEILSGLVRACPRLSRSILCALKSGTGASLPAEEAQVPQLALPLGDSRALTLALAKARSGPLPFGSLRFLIRVGSCPPFIAGTLLGALALFVASALCLAWGGWRRLAWAVLPLAPLAWLGAGLAGDLRARPGQEDPLRRMAGIRRSALEQRRQLPSADLDFLGEQIECPDARLRQEAAYTWAIASLACPRDARRIDRLIRALEEREDPDDPRQRQWAAVALGQSGDAAAVPRLIEALQDPSFLVRNKAAVALGELRDARAISPLLQMTQKDIWYNAACARESLRRLGR